MIATLLALVSLAAWLVLIAARGRFWLIPPVDRVVAKADLSRIAVTAVIPARNEADLIGESVGSIMAQGFAGRLRIVVVDDQSEDATAEAVGRIGDGRVHVVSGRPLPTGWTGKLWAMAQGVEASAIDGEPPDYIWFTDADIVHDRDVLASLVAEAEAEKAALVSRMARLRCESTAEHWLIPAFVFFFRKLYPFAWVAAPGRRTAAAAGGCMLVRRRALAAAGGLDAVRGALIDDCAIGALLKPQGPVRLDLTDRTRSIRPYPRLRDIGDMIARSAYAQLNYSPLLLALTVLGMGLLYLAPPLTAIFAAGAARWAGLLAWALMVLAYAPMLRFYGLSPARGIALPLVAALYTCFTIQSALRYALGQGGRWKGRVEARPLAGGTP